MRKRTSRLGRWRQQIAIATKLVNELACLVQSLTLLANKASRFTLTVTGLVAAMHLFLNAL